MTTKPTTRRTVLASTAAISVAIGTGAIAVPADSACSFPDLVAQFVQMRERWRDRRAADATWNEFFDGLFEKQAGIPIKEFYAMDASDPGRKKYEAVFFLIYNQNPDPRCDEDGVDIAWTEINRGLNSLAGQILLQQPRSLTDLAWQAEVLFLTEPELSDPDYGDDDKGLVFTFIRNVRALGGLS